MNQFRYLISYAYNAGRDLGRIDITSPVPLQSLDDVVVVEQDLREHNELPDAFVLSFSRYADRYGR